MPGVDDEVEKEGGRLGFLKGSSFFSEFLVDILGGFLPGLFYVTGATVAITPAIYVIYMSYSVHSGLLTFSNLKKLLDSTKETPSTIWFFLFMGGVCLIYIIGQIFYRRDPKEPDKRSYLKLEWDEIIAWLRRNVPKNSAGFGLLGKVFFKYDFPLRGVLFDMFLLRILPLRWILGKQKLKDICEKEIIGDLKANLACCKESQCEFPYPYLADYLEKRGLDHLAKFVLWDEDSMKKRSKTTINILKVRLNQYFPSQYKYTLKLEAHVRLTSSTWYASGSVMKLSLASIFLLFGFSMLIRYVGTGHETIGFSSLMNHYFLPLAFPVSTCLVGYYCKRKIEQFLHYQRLKEVVTVLETVFTAFRSMPETLSPPFTDVFPDNLPVRVQAILGTKAKSRSKAVSGLTP